jgi:hypothetical protein
VSSATLRPSFVFSSFFSNLLMANGCWLLEKCQNANARAAQPRSMIEK